MKPLLLAAATFLAFAPLLHAQSVASVVSRPPAPTPVPDLVTRSGQTYKQARVFRVEPDGINYMFAGGMAKIAFDELPDAVQKQYGYDPAKARVFAAQDAAAQAQAADAGERSMRAARERDIAVAVDNRKDVTAAKQRASDEQARLDWKRRIAPQGKHVKVTVIRQTDDGALVSYRVRIGLYQWPSEDQDDTIFIKDLPRKLADGDTWEGDLYPCGTFQPNGSGGKTYHEFCSSLDAAAALQVHD